MIDGKNFSRRTASDDTLLGEHRHTCRQTGERVEIMFHNMSMMAHPMHLHGHAFQVVGVGQNRIAGAVRDAMAALRAS